MNKIFIWKRKDLDVKDINLSYRLPALNSTVERQNLGRNESMGEIEQNQELWEIDLEQFDRSCTLRDEKLGLDHQIKVKNSCERKRRDSLLLESKKLSKLESKWKKLTLSAQK